MSLTVVQTFRFCHKCQTLFYEGRRACRTQRAGARRAVPTKRWGTPSRSRLMVWNRRPFRLGGGSVNRLGECSSTAPPVRDAAPVVATVTVERAAPVITSVCRMTFRARRPPRHSGGSAGSALPCSMTVTRRKAAAAPAAHISHRATVSCCRTGVPEGRPTRCSQSGRRPARSRRQLAEGKNVDPAAGNAPFIRLAVTTVGPGRRRAVSSVARWTC